MQRIGRLLRFVARMKTDKNTHRDSDGFDVPLCEGFRFVKVIVKSHIRTVSLVF